MRAWIRLTDIREGHAVVVDVNDVEMVHERTMFVNDKPAPYTSVNLDNNRLLAVKESAEDVLRLMMEAERRVERDLSYIAEEAAVRARREA